MFCPKCGSQNPDETRFCRGCGSDLSNVLAVVVGRELPRVPALVEKHLELFSAGLRALVVGIGLVLVGGLALGISIRLAVLTIFAFAISTLFIGAGVSRLFQARALKRLLTPTGAPPTTPSLPEGEQEYIRPQRSIYETEDLVTPRSVTEHTTTHLKIDRD